MLLYFQRQSPITTRASVRVHSCSRLRHSSRKRAWKLSMYPFCQGLPGSIYRDLIPSRDNHSRRFFSINSDPLSHRICSGAPYYSIRRAITRWTFSALILRSTWIHRDSRVYSSRTVSMRSLPPRIVVSWTKSQVQTWLGCVALVGRPVEMP